MAKIRVEGLKCPECAKLIAYSVVPLVAGDLVTTEGIFFKDGSVPRPFDRVECQFCGASPVNKRNGFLGDGFIEDEIEDPRISAKKG